MAAPTALSLLTAAGETHTSQHHALRMRINLIWGKMAAPSAPSLRTAAGGGSKPRPARAPRMRQAGGGKMAASSLEQKLSRLEAKLKQENREARRRIDLNLDIGPARARPSKRNRGSGGRTGRGGRGG